MRSFHFSPSPSQLYCTSYTFGVSLRMEEARQPDSTHSMLRGDSSIQLSFSRVQSPRTYLVPS